MGGRFGREGLWVYLWLILVDVLNRKPQNSVKQLSFNLKKKIKNLKKKKKRTTVKVREQKIVFYSKQVGQERAMTLCAN